MKNLKTQLRLASLLALILLACTAAYGQITPSGGPHRAALTVKVPFDFVVGNQTFPAGTYKFRSLLNSVPGKDTIDVLEVRSTDGRRYSAIVTDALASGDPDNPRLVFTRWNGRAFLSEVWEPGKQAGCRLQSRKDQTQPAVSENDKVTLIASSERR